MPKKSLTTLVYQLNEMTGNGNYRVNQQCCSGGNYPEMEGFLTKFKIENMSPQETPEIKH